MTLKNKTAFTLAEVLVTLAIIGVVASLTIPSLIKSYQKTQYEVGYKKSYAELSQATRMIMADNGGTLNGIAYPGHNVFRDFYASYLKTNTICGFDTTLGTCWHENNQWFNLDGSAAYTGNTGIGLVINSGVLITFFSLSETCTHNLLGVSDACGYITIDVNGFKGPNVGLKDIHVFVLNSQGKLIPDGAPGTETETDCRTTEGAYCGYQILKGHYEWED